MISLIKSVQHLHFNKKAMEKIELPLFTLNKLCYAFLNNDFIMVASSMVTLLTTLTLIGITKIHYINQ